MIDWERVGEDLIAYLLERTHLTRSEVEQVLDVQEEFWDAHPHLVRIELADDDEPDA